MITQEELKQLLHYDPETGVFTRKSTGKVTGSVGRNGKNTHVKYVRISINGVLYKAHRLAWLYVIGDNPAYVIDHINGDGTDNRFCNLRDVPQVINSRNAKINSNSVSLVSGVSWRNSRKVWRSRIMIDGVEVFLGHFTDFFEAVCARKSAERRHGFHINHGRIV